MGSAGRKSQEFVRRTGHRGPEYLVKIPGKRQSGQESTCSWSVRRPGVFSVCIAGNPTDESLEMRFRRLGADSLVHAGVVAVFRPEGWGTDGRREPGRLGGSRGQGLAGAVPCGLGQAVTVA